MYPDPYLRFGTSGAALHYMLTLFEARVRRDERGEITEKTILIAGFALVTLAVLAVIGTKLMSTINNVDTNPPAPVAGP